MAEYFVATGWSDVTIALPFNPRETDAVNRFPSKVHLQLLVQSEEVVKHLNEHLERSVNVLIKVDTGYGRTGVKWDNLTALKSLKDNIEASTKMSFSGFLTHAGHAYDCRGIDEILAVQNQTLQRFQFLKDHFGEALTYSIGDTPTCSVSTEFAPATEIRPGNFVFYDQMRAQIGASNPAQIAVCLAVPVIALYPDEHKVVVHGGGVHLSKDALEDSTGKNFGGVVKFSSQGWSSPLPGWKVIKLSQEHGTLLAPSQEAVSELTEGDWLAILPVHSCMTANLMKNYSTLNGRSVDHLEGG